MIVFDSDDLQVIYRPGGSDWLLITFNAIATRADGSTFFALPVADRMNLSALGFVSKRPNWFPQGPMLRAIEAAASQLERYQERVTFGYSMGAYGAIKYSGGLGATTVISVCPQSSIDPSDTSDFDPSYNHYYKKHLNGDMRIVRSDVAGNVTVFYDPRHDVDTRHAQVIAEAISPNLIKMPYTLHESMTCFRGTRAVMDLFSLCRSNDQVSIRIYAARRRKAAWVRAYGVGLATVRRRPSWASGILQKFGHTFTEAAAGELAIRLGESLLRLQRPHDAVTAFEQAFGIVPRDRRALSGLAEAELRRDNFSGAASYLRKLSEIEPGNAGTHERLALVLLKSGDFDTARTEALRASGLSPDSLGPIRLLADIDIHEKKLLDALHWLRLAVAHDAGGFHDRERLCHFAFHAGDLDQARKTAVTLLNEPSKSAWAKQMLAYIEEKDRNLNKAIEWTKEVVAAEPVNYHVMNKLAHLLLRSGDLDAAEDVAKRALEGGDDNAFSKRILSDITHQREGWERFVHQHRHLCRVVQTLSPAIVFLGDSITDQWLHAGRPIWEARFAPLGAAALAISGSTTARLKWQIANGLLDEIRPVIIVLMIGTNDIQTWSADHIVHEISELVTSLTAIQPQALVLLLGIAPRGALPSDEIRGDIAAINARLSGLQDGTTVTFLDMTQALLEPDGTLTNDVAPDGLHLSEKGYERLAAQLEHGLLAMLIKALQRMAG